MLICERSEKDVLLASGDPAFFTTSHYDSHGSILVRIDLVDEDEFAELIAETWRTTAPARIRRKWEQQTRHQGTSD